ncbi:MAG: ABC transporter ATP-binding protein [Nanoarchaeota archaeon]
MKKEKVDIKENFKNYLWFAKKWKWIFLVVIFISLIIECIHIFEKFLIKNIVDNSTEFVAKQMTTEIFISGLLIIAGLYIISSLILKVLGNWIQLRIINSLEASMMLEMKQKFFNHIIHLSHNFHTTHKTGSLISRMNRGNKAIESISDFIVFNISPLLLQMIVASAAIIYFDITSAIIIVMTSLTFIIFGFFMSKVQQRSQYEANVTEDLERGVMADIFMNIDSVKHFGKEELMNNKFQLLGENTRKKMLEFWNFGSWFNAGQSLILGIGTFSLFYFTITKIISGNITVGTLVFIYTVYLGLVGPLFGFVQGMRKFYIALGDLDSLYEYEKITNDIKDEANPEKLKINKGEIEFKNISFRYNKNRVIDKFSLKINPNEKVAFVGHSGCGKTTLVKLLYRLYDVESGQILIDNENIKKFKQESLREELSIVPQECILFDDTIYNNIAFSNPKASKKEVFQAIKFAQLDNFIESLPNKENTIVGERGVKLSGGEKQRVSVARAILANKKVLVLDEATSALDSKTEHEIQKDLEMLMQGRTSIIIAHRLSTIMKADKIVVMEKGRIVQIGKHRELINKKGVYKELWNLQKGGYIKE